MEQEIRSRLQGVAEADVPAVVAHLQDKDGSLTFQKGKSCSFHMELSELQMHLRETPLYVMVLDLWDPDNPRYVGSTSIPLDGAGRSLEEGKAAMSRGNSLCASAEVAGTFPVYNMMGTRTGRMSLSCKLSSQGGSYLSAGSRSASSHYQHSQDPRLEKLVHDFGGGAVLAKPKLSEPRSVVFCPPPLFYQKEQRSAVDDRDVLENTQDDPSQIQYKTAEAPLSLNFSVLGALEEELRSLRLYREAFRKRAPKVQHKDTHNGTHNGTEPTPQAELAVDIAKLVSEELLGQFAGGNQVPKRQAWGVDDHDQGPPDELSGSLRHHEFDPDEDLLFDYSAVGTSPAESPVHPLEENNRWAERRARDQSSATFIADDSLPEEVPSRRPNRGPREKPARNEPGQRWKDDTVQLPWSQQRRNLRKPRRKTPATGDHERVDLPPSAKKPPHLKVRLTKTQMIREELNRQPGPKYPKRDTFGRPHAGLARSVEATKALETSHGEHSTPDYKVFRSRRPRRSTPKARRSSPSETPVHHTYTRARSPIPDIQLDDSISEHSKIHQSDSDFDSDSVELESYRTRSVRASCVSPEKDSSHTPDDDFYISSQNKRHQHSSDEESVGSASSGEDADKTDPTSVRRMMQARFAPANRYASFPDQAAADGFQPHDSLGSSFSSAFPAVSNRLRNPQVANSGPTDLGSYEFGGSEDDSRDEHYANDPIKSNETRERFDSRRSDTSSDDSGRIHAEMVNFQITNAEDMVNLQITGKTHETAISAITPLTSAAGFSMRPDTVETASMLKQSSLFEDTQFPEISVTEYGESTFAHQPSMTESIISLDDSVPQPSTVEETDRLAEATPEVRESVKLVQEHEAHVEKVNNVVEAQRMRQSAALKAKLEARKAKRNGTMPKKDPEPSEPNSDTVRETGPKISVTEASPAKDTSTPTVAASPGGSSVLDRIRKARAKLQLGA